MGPSFNDLTEQVIACAIEVHRCLGPGLLEVKAVNALDALHEAQVLSYLKLSGHPVALLINFNVRLLSRGVRRLTNGFDGNEPRSTQRAQREENLG